MLTDWLEPLVRELLDNIDEPILWLTLLVPVLLGGLFVYGVIRRRDPPVLALIGVGLLVGLGIAWTDSPWKGIGTHLALGGTLASIGWVVMAVPIAMAAVIQPGGPAPLTLRPLTLHFGLVLACAVFLSTWEPEISFAVLPSAAVAFCAGRDSERVREAWRTATTLLAAHVSLMSGFLLIVALSDPQALSLLVIEGCFAGIAISARWSAGASTHWLGRTALLIALSLAGAASAFSRHEVLTKIAIYALFKGPLPRCGDHGSRSIEDRSVGTLAWPGQIIVASADEDVSSLLRTPQLFACTGNDMSYAYASYLQWGQVGIDLRRIDGTVQLADGAIPSQDALQAAAKGCTLPDLWADGRASTVFVTPNPDDVWPVSVLAVRCRRPWSCVVPRELCTHDADRGWHLRPTGLHP